MNGETILNIVFIAHSDQRCGKLNFLLSRCGKKISTNIIVVGLYVQCAIVGKLTRYKRFMS